MTDTGEAKNDCDGNHDYDQKQLATEDDMPPTPTDECNGICITKQKGYFSQAKDYAP
jgi:hypothetical protein